ncbi:C4-dicarboxylate-binding periplasmic protein [Aromatoleum petrolei]|nr:C4-dicarboxylate-binding periplasmic protein [Aromatoleum petrolei]
MLLGLPLVAFAPRGEAQESRIELRIADSLPAGHIIAENLTKPWMKLATELSGGRLVFKYYPAEQMGKAKDMLTLTQSGVIDIGYVGPSYISEKMPLSAVAELPGAATNACQVMRAYWSLAKDDGPLYTNEFKPNRIRPLLVAALPPYQIVLGSSKSVSSLKDLEGTKLRASGGAQNLTLDRLNVIPVRMSPPEIYESMSRGTIDGTLFSFVSVESYKLTPLTKTATVGSNFGTVLVTYSISDAKWAKLPPEAKRALIEAGDRTVQSACAAFDAQERAAGEKLKSAGAQLVEFKGADGAAFGRIADEVASAWAADLDKRGKPGTATLTAFRDALAKAK